MSTTAAAPPTRSIARSAGSAAAVAIIINVLLGQIAPALGAATLPMLTPGPIVIFTLIGLVGAAVVYGLLQGRSKDPDRLFTIIAAVVLVISFVPDLLLLGMPAMPPAGPDGAAMPPITGSVPLTVVTLILMHIVAAASIVFFLTRRGRSA